MSGPYCTNDNHVSSHEKSAMCQEIDVGTNVIMSTCLWYRKINAGPTSRQHRQCQHSWKVSKVSKKKKKTKKRCLADVIILTWLRYRKIMSGRYCATVNNVGSHKKSAKCQKSDVGPTYYFVVIDYDIVLLIRFHISSIVKLWYQKINVRPILRHCQQCRQS